MFWNNDLMNAFAGRAFKIIGESDSVTNTSNISTKHSILDVWQCSEYASAVFTTEKRMRMYSGAKQTGLKCLLQKIDKFDKESRNDANRDMFPTEELNHEILGRIFDICMVEIKTGR